MDYGWDAAGRLATVKDNRLEPPNVTSYGYDAAGNSTTVAYPNGVVATNTYDTVNRMLGRTFQSGTSPILGYDYTLGPTGNVSAVVEQSGRSVQYTYDALYRLTGEAITSDPNGNNGAINYTLDSAGNRLARTSTVAAIPATNSSYDADDRLQNENFDANGDLLASGLHQYVYDFEDHLVSFDHGTGTIAYDGDGNRVSRLTSGLATQFLVDDQNPTGYPQAVEDVVNGAPQAVYTFGRDPISNNRAGAVHFYGLDGQTSVRFLMDASSAVTDAYDYDAFGVAVRASGMTANPIRYAGEPIDSDLGFVYLRARYMDPATGNSSPEIPFSAIPTSLLRPIDTSMQSAIPLIAATRQVRTFWRTCLLRLA